MAILILPIPRLTRLRIHLKQRAILVFVFGVGLLVIVVDILRAWNMQKVTREHLESQDSFELIDLAHVDFTC